MRIDVVLANASPNALDWVYLEWKGPDLVGGIIPAGAWKMTSDVKWPNLPSAKITFVDDKTSEPYTLEVSFASINEEIGAGKCHKVTIRILNYDKAEVICE